MLKTIRSKETDEILEVVEAIPICGKDFCEDCLECLSCYGEDECPYSDGGHYWVEYK